MPLMKLPRWLVIAMLTTSVLAVLAAAGCCWVTWPERTARDFVVFMNAGKVDDAIQMIQMETEPQRPRNWSPEAFIPQEHTQIKFEPEPRTLLDMLAGRLEFRVPEPFPDLIEYDDGGRPKHAVVLTFHAWSSRGLTLVAQGGSVWAEYADWVRLEVVETSTMSDGRMRLGYRTTNESRESDDW